MSKLSSGGTVLWKLAGAPGDMVKIYGPARSFNRKVGEVVSAVSMRIPLSAAYASTKTFVLQLSAVLLFTFLAIYLLAVVASNYLVFKPIKLMSNKATQIASDRNHLGETIEIKHGQELSELAKAFNFMSVSLRNTYDSLENTIEERTASIEKTKNQLELDIEQRKQVEAELIKAKEDAEKAHAELEKIAATDYLTGVLNRRAFMERLEIEFERCRRSNRHFGIVITDIDNFKNVNDKFGHPVGDKVLKLFAEAISKDCRPYDFVGRFGGEEFIVCLSDVSIEELLKIGERMCEEVRDLKIRVESQNEILQITASFGVALLELNDRDSIEAIDWVINKADKALYHAKSLGKDRVSLGE